MGRVKNLLSEPEIFKPGESVKAGLGHVATISHDTRWGAEGGCTGRHVVGHSAAEPRG